MIAKRYKIPLRDGQPFYLIPIGDVHYNVDACDRDKFHETINQIVTLKKNGAIVRIIGMGDYNDIYSPSERVKLRGANLHDTTYEELDRTQAQLVRDYADAVKPLWKDHLGILGHHHLSEFSDRKKYNYENSDDMLSQIIGCDYFGVIALIQLEFPHGQVLKIGAHHGYGGGRTPGYLITKRINLASIFPHANILLMGHDHHKLSYGDHGIDFDINGEGNITSVKRKYIATGSFLRGYAPNSTKGTYVEALALRPADLGVVMIKAELVKKGKSYKLDWRAIE